MNKEIIEFKKQRDLGEILTDIFKFIRLEGKNLLINIVKITWIPFLIFLAANTYYLAVLGGFTNFLTLGNQTIFTGKILLAMFSMIIASLLFISMLYLSVLSYIKLYVKHKGVISFEKMNDIVKENFWNYILLALSTGLMMVIGMMLCVLPGIYFMVVLFPVFAVMIFENKSIDSSIRTCFDLIKGEWWITFATIIVIYLLYYIISMIFQMPILIYQFARGFGLSQDFQSGSFEMFDLTTIILNIIAQAGQYILYPILIIASVLVYFNLNEKLNHSGTIEKIDSIGERD